MFRPLGRLQSNLLSSLGLPSRRGGRSAIRRASPPFVLAAALVAALALPAATVEAQTTLSEMLRTVFVNDVVLARTPAASGVVAHTPIFAEDPRITSVTNLVDQVSQYIGAQASRLPLGSSAGGFTYSFDPVVGVFNRSTSGFGPAFVDRAVTIGKLKWNFGATYMHTSYNTLDGRDLENGDIHFYLEHEPLAPASFVSGDVIRAALSLKLTSDVFAVFTNVGLTNSIDVGVAIPFVDVAMDATYRGTILDFATHTTSPSTHLFANGSKTQDFVSQGSASGVGDLVVRAKYNFLKRSGGGMAAALDLRLPTGDDTNFLGAGATQAKLSLVMSRSVGKIAPHVDVGYTFSGGGATFSVPDQVNYAGGIEYAATPRITVLGDLIGRTDRGALRLTDTPITHTFQQANGAPFETAVLPAIGTTVGNISTGVLAGGVKLNPWRTLLVSAHVLVQLNEAGLRDRVTPVIGFEYTF